MIEEKTYCCQQDETVLNAVKQHQNFHYIPCLSGKQVLEGFTHGRVNEVALAALADLKGWRVFLCGHPQMVNQMKKMTFLKGAAMKDIYADAFNVTPAENLI